MLSVPTTSGGNLSTVRVDPTWAGANYGAFTPSSLRNSVKHITPHLFPNRLALGLG